MKSYRILAILGLILSQVSADPVSLNRRPRMQMMGGSGLAASGSKESAMMNPAGLSDIEKSKLEYLPLLFEVPFEIDTVESFLDFQDQRDAAENDQSKKRAALETFMDKVASEAAATRFNFYPSYTAKHLHVGFLLDVLVDARLRAGAATSNEVIHLGGSAGTTGLIVGGSYSFLENRLHVGGTLKPLYRFSVVKEDSQTLHDILLGKNLKADGSGERGIEKVLVGEDYVENRAFGVGADLGLRYDLFDLPYMDQLKPSVGLTYQDIGNTRFFTDNNQPANIPQSISLGAALQPTIWIFKNTFSFDLRNLNEEQELMNMIHLGAETVIWDILALRAGLSQGYFTGGVGLDLKFFTLDAYVSSWEAGRKAHIQSQNVVGLQISGAI